MLGDHRDTAETLTLLAEIATKLNKVDEAENAYRECLRIRRKVLSADQPATANALCNLADLLRAKKRWREAENFYREALAIREKQMQNAWQTFQARSLLGETLVEQDKYSEAESLLISGYEGLKQREYVLPSDKKNLADEALQRLAKYYEKTGRSEKAAECRKKLVSLQKGATE